MRDDSGLKQGKVINWKTERLFKILTGIKHRT